jgi:hypothetical protein
MHAHIASTATRWRELDVLISQAEHAGVSSDASSAICRATTVMIVAHLEGFLRDTVRAVINDANTHSEFQYLPNPAKRIFCRLYTGTDPEGTGQVGKEGNEREQRLIELFEKLNPEVTHEPFTSGFANPKPDVIARMCKNFGVDFFWLIDGSKLDDVFSGNPGAITTVLPVIETALLAGLGNYPYTLDRTQFGFGALASPKVRNKETLWHAFVNDLLHQRHSVAHGASLNNSKSSHELREAKGKAMILAYAVAFSLCSV